MKNFVRGVSTTGSETLMCNMPAKYTPAQQRECRSVLKVLDSRLRLMRTHGEFALIFENQDSTVMHMKKFAIAAVLLVFIAGLVWLVWIQTKLLAVTLGLLIVFLIALYFVLRKM